MEEEILEFFFYFLLITVVDMQVSDGWLLKIVWVGGKLLALA